MKNIFVVKMRLFLLYGFLILAASAAQAGAIQYPETDDQVYQSLASQILTSAQIAEVCDPYTGCEQDENMDLVVIGGREIVPPPSSEGIPTGYSPAPADVIEGAYSSAELISLALSERESLPLGRRIPFLEEQAGRIIEISGNRPQEILLRLTLNRSVDILHHVLPIAGRNTSEIARWLANFMRENFELAASMGNNGIAVESRVSPTPADALRKMSIAEYGRIYSTLLWRYSQDLGSDWSKAVVLMRLVGYLGWDFNSDLRRRERPIAQTIADIYALQHSPLYTQMLRMLAAGQEPSQSELAQLRRKIFTLLERLPARMKEAGVFTK